MSSEELTYPSALTEDFFVAGNISDDGLADTGVHLQPLWSVLYFRTAADRCRRKQLHDTAEVQVVVVEVALCEFNDSVAQIFPL